MYVSASQLTDTFRAMPIAELVARLESGNLAPEARAIGETELKARLARGESVPLEVAPAASPMPRRRVLGVWPRRIAVGMYLAFLAVCLAGTALDPPSNLQRSDAYSGIVGLIATQAAGFPLNLVVVLAVAPLASTHAPTQSHAYAFVALSWLCACVNVAVLWWLLRPRVLGGAAGA